MNEFKFCDWSVSLISFFFYLSDTFMSKVIFFVILFSFVKWVSISLLFCIIYESLNHQIINLLLIGKHNAWLSTILSKKNNTS